MNHSLVGHARIERLAERVHAALPTQLRRMPALPDEICYEADAGQLLEVAQRLRDDPALRFEMLIDLAGIDYLHFGATEWTTTDATRTGFSRGVRRDAPAERVSLAPPRRFAVVYQLLSITHNERLRLRVFCDGDDEYPMLDSVTGIWAAANWYEREAFDLFGILFRGHPDLRRILTDYGFIGHPFRKDFPLIGNVEVRYDERERRIVYEPVDIEPRVLVPKVIRDDARYEPALKSKPHG
ncbi:MAG: NADH-quinone oxidoreductase subunit C [Steroidobacteraceae bacterium]|nr:NADH-quinone oxidoreductase subunit C [Steroidobacteraceae bacterium]MDW8259840.1 NADH-quinone oxidoreductase subunit C [Gammaproteobacteria bacterium]